MLGGGRAVDTEDMTNDGRTTAHAATRFPGWYLDPMDPMMERFWDGLHWGSQRRPGLELADYLGPIEPVLASLLDDGSEAEKQNGPEVESTPSPDAVLDMLND